MENGKTEIDVDKIVNHFKESSEEDFKTMLNLYLHDGGNSNWCT